MCSKVKRGAATACVHIGSRDVAACGCRRGARGRCNARGRRCRSAGRAAICARDRDCRGSGNARVRADARRGDVLASVRRGGGRRRADPAATRARAHLADAVAAASAPRVRDRTRFGAAARRARGARASEARRRDRRGRLDAGARVRAREARRGRASRRARSRCRVCGTHARAERGARARGRRERRRCAARADRDPRRTPPLVCDARARRPRADRSRVRRRATAPRRADASLRVAARVRAPARGARHVRARRRRCRGTRRACPLASRAAGASPGAARDEEGQRADPAQLAERMLRGMTSPGEAFAKAREILLRHRDDPERARAEFRWPVLDAWNWVDDWFEPYAAGVTRPALQVVREQDVETTSFGELVERSRRVARWLRDHGAAPGDRMLVMLTNVTPLWETMLAAIRLGVVVIPATPQLTSHDLDDLITRGNVKHLVTDRDGAAKLREPERLTIRLCTSDAPGFTHFDDAHSAPNELARTPTRAVDPLLLYFTSGTTAKPKLVLHTHASYPIGHLSTMYWIGIREGDIHQNISSPGWAKHAWSSLFAPWNAGATIVVHDQARFSASRTFGVVRDHGITTLCAPPTVWRMLILESLGERPAALRELVSAGEPLNPEVIDAVERAWGITVRDGYGQTETTAQVGNSPGMVVKPGAMGKPLPGYEIALLDSEGKPAREGEVSILLTERPLSLMAGYLDDPERTAQVMAHGWYRTGDEASIDDDGYIRFIGRGDDVFKSSDYKVSPFA